MWTLLTTLTFDITEPVSLTELIPSFSEDTLLKTTSYQTILVPFPFIETASVLTISYEDPSGNSQLDNIGGLSMFTNSPIYTNGMGAFEKFELIGANTPINYIVRPLPLNPSPAFLAGYTIHLILETMPA